VPPPSTFNTLSDEITNPGSVISGLTLSLWSCGSTSAGCTTATQVASNSSYIIASGDQIENLAVNDLSAGYYYLQVQGTTTGTSFSGNVGLTPIPSTLALFAGGLGLLGATLRKRRKGRAGRLDRSAISGSVAA
jgi:hypothetical protein